MVMLSAFEVVKSREQGQIALARHTGLVKVSVAIVSYLTLDVAMNICRLQRESLVQKCSSVRNICATRCKGKYSSPWQMR